MIISLLHFFNTYQKRVLFGEYRFTAFGNAFRKKFFLPFNTTFSRINLIVQNQY